MASRKAKPAKSVEEKETPVISVNLHEIEAKIRQNAEELETFETQRKGQKEDVRVDGDKMTQKIDKLKTEKGVIGYILRNSMSASVDLKDPTRIVDYATLSSSALEASEGLAESFKLGSVKHIVVEGNTAKLLSFAVKDNKVSVFMEKNVDHKRIYKNLST